MDCTVCLTVDLLKIKHNYLCLFHLLWSVTFAANSPCLCWQLWLMYGYQTLFTYKCMYFMTLQIFHAVL
jgi:hypothetical protein